MGFPPGHAKLGGRRKGGVNNDTKKVAALALQHGPDAIAKLRNLMDNAHDERAQVAAAKELLERAYGKTSQTLGIDPNANGIRVTIIGDDAKL